MRAQIERQFNNTFEGRLQIGHLSGNLLNTLYANNIQLLDSTGVLVASIDAAVLKPTWLELLSGTVSLKHITLIQPEFNILYQKDSTWNISSVLKKQKSGVNAPMLGAFTSSDIKIMDGTIQTHYEDHLPEDISSGKIFNYADATISGIQAQMNIEWQGESKLFDIDEFALYIVNEDIELADLHGQILWAEDRLEFNEVFIESEETWFEFSGFVDQLGLLKTTPGEAAIDLDLRNSRLDADAISLLFPTFPLADTLRLASRISGTLNALDIQSIEVNRGELSLNANGYVTGYPDSLSFIAELFESNFSQPDLKRILPDLNLDLFAEDFNPSIDRIQARGAVNIINNKFQEPHYGKVSLALENEGTVTGNAEFSRVAVDSLMNFNAYLTADSVNFESILDNFKTPTLINGTVAAKGAGATIAQMASDISMRLMPSTIGKYAIDTLETFATYEAGAIDLHGMVRNDKHGTIGAIVALDLNEPFNKLKADFAVEKLNAGFFIPNDSLSTNLAAKISIDGLGNTLESIRGAVDIEIEPSELTLGTLQQQIPAHAVRIAFQDVDDGFQALTLEGDIAQGRLKGQFNLTEFQGVSNEWKQLIKQTFEEIFYKQQQQVQTALTANDTTDPTPATDPQNEIESPALIEHPQVNTFISGLGQISPEDTTALFPKLFELDLAFRQSTLIRSWLPNSPHLATDAKASFEIESSPTFLSVTGEVIADSMVINDVVLNALDGDISLSSNLNKPAENRLSVYSQIDADSVLLLGQSLPFPTFLVDISEGNGRINLATKSNQKLGPQRLRTLIEILPDRNRVHFEELFLSIGNSSWTTYSPAQIDIIEKKIFIPGLELQSKSAEANILQTVQLSGVLSPNPSDTASIDINNIAIRPISQFLNMARPLGGLISGQMAFTTTNDQPEITGTINVDRFSLDNRVLGDINISSQYIPRQPDVGLQIALTPIAPFNQEQFLPDAVIPAIYEENELSINGTFRLPKLNELQTGFLDAGSLDLDLNLYRADVFFFEYIFPNFLSRADGYLTGGGKIVGNFDTPVFDTRLELKDGEIDIPKFNLQYTDFTGVLNIDKDAIHLEDGTFRDPTGGIATMSGDFLFNDYRYFSFDIVGGMDELLIMNQDFQEDLPFYGQIWGSGSLTLTGPAFNAMLISNDAITKASSELFIPVTEDEVASDVGFLIFADSSGNIPDFQQLAYRKNLLSKRPEGERKFVDGLSIDLNIEAPSGSTIHLVFDPLLGDAMNAVSSGRIQIQRREGEFATYGTLNVESGDYLFTAGDVFARRFIIDRGGTITWDGNPIDARLQIPASYQTRASVAGLPENAYQGDHIPVIVELNISGRVSSPEVDLGLRANRSDRSYRGNYEAMEAILNQSERLTDYATSVMLTNSFLLTTESAPDTGTLTNSGNQIAFTSVSQLVASQLNRFLGEALPNVDLNLGLQGESLEDPEVTYGVALYLLDQRLVIRGEGVYQNEISNQPDLEGEFEVEVRLNSNVSVSVFLRREGDLFQGNELTSTRGAGLSYQTEFSSWRRFFNRLFGGKNKKKKPETPTDQVAISPNE
ncbi:MAG: translocation/assembly module TamB domain-containing protein [Rhodothermales bacterium]